VSCQEIRFRFLAPLRTGRLGVLTLSSGPVSEVGIREEATGGSGLKPDVAQTQGPRRWWWLGALLVVVSLIVGGTAQHYFDQRRAGRALYQIQVLTTASRFITEEQSQIALPVAQRNVNAFGDLADSITADQGVNGASTLQITVGSGSVAPFTQIAFDVTVSSLYASTTFVVWFVRDAGSGGVSGSDIGTCALSSSLLGSGRATTSLELGGGAFIQPCWPQLWSASSRHPMDPDLALAGIPQTAGG
jgi:hypothetical protein